MTTSTLPQDKKSQKLLNAYIEHALPQMNGFMDIENIAKSIMGPMINKMLQSEMDHHLGYERHAKDGYNSGNSRNGAYKKTIHTSQGDMQITVPRDRTGSFEPAIVEKNQRTVGSLESKIIKMMALGMTAGDICENLEEAYGAKANKEMIKTVSDALIPEIKAWRNKPLQAFYSVVYLDAVHFKVRDGDRYVSKAAYVILGLGIGGIKDVLGICLGENESASFWQKMCTNLKNRGIEDILFACVDGLSGFGKAVTSNFPGTMVQRCIVHQIRATTRYVPHKERKQFISDLKKIYKASTLELAETALLELQEKRGKRYAASVNSWVNNRDELSAYFAYGPSIRKLIYTTNPIESFNRQLRNVTKKIPVFPNEMSLMKRLYLGSERATKKRTMPARNWGEILGELVLHFGDRVEKWVV